MNINGFKPIGKVGFGNVINDNIYTIYSKNGITTSPFIDREDINPLNVISGTWDERGFIIKNPNFKYAIETNQVDFVSNSMISYN